MSALAPGEIRALARIIDELDYYQLIHARRGATARELKDAYYETSRTFHPDANRHLDPDLREAVERIARRVTEAYSVLRNPRRRAAYDRRLVEGGCPRMQLVEAEAEAQRRSQQEQGRTPQGRQYHALARADLERGDLAAAARNLQTALAFEPDNRGFQEQLAALRARPR